MLVVSYGFQFLISLFASKMSILSSGMPLGPLISASVRSVTLVEFHLERSLDTSTISILPSLGSSGCRAASEDQRSPNLVMRRAVGEKMVVLSETLVSWTG